jgi:hypothetical protein
LPVRDRELGDEHAEEKKDSQNKKAFPKARYRLVGVYPLQEYQQAEAISRAGGSRYREWPQGLPRR